MQGFLKLLEMHIKYDIAEERDYIHQYLSQEVEAVGKINVTEKSNQ